MRIHFPFFINDERCRFLRDESCPLRDPKAFTCLHEEEAARGNNGKPYCGEYPRNEFRYKYK